MLVFSILILIGLASLAIDVGYWRYQRGLEQNAADSAALAGAVQLGYSTTLSGIVAAAQTAAASNGFTNNGSTVDVTVNRPPLYGSYTTNSSAVEVIVAVKQPVHFAALFTQSSTVVIARAVAVLSSSNRICLWVMGTSSSSITLDGGTISMPGCGIITNGGLLLNGGTVNASSIGYASGASGTDSSVTFTGASPAVAIAPVDPCGVVAGCSNLTATPPTSGSCATTTTFNSAPVTVQPGVYCSQVMFNGGGAVTFAPGVYDFQQGLTVNSATSLSGTGVTFYNQGTFIIDGSPTVNLSAPTTGSTAGVLFYQPASNSAQFILNGAGTGGTWQGMIYVPSSEITVDGSPAMSWPMIVAGSILLNGSAGMNITSSAFPDYGHAVLAE